jgi:GntR family transcriptional regulator
MEAKGTVPHAVNTSPRRLYTQAIDSLHELLDRGEYKPGDLLPPEAVLARQMGVSRSTLREAMGHLESHGLVVRRRGLGTYVGAPATAGFQGSIERLEPFREVAARAGLAAECAERELAAAPASAELAALLNVPAGTPLTRVQVVEAVNGRRTAYFDSHLLLESAEAEALREYGGSVMNYLIERHHPPLSHTRTEFQALSAGPEVAAKLGVPPGQPVLHLCEIYYASDAAPMAVSLNYLLTDEFRYHVIRRLPSRVERRG